MAIDKKDELNPDHPVTKSLHEQWHKLCMILLSELNDGQEFLITDEIVKRFVEKYNDHAILAHETKAGLRLKIVTMEEGRRLTVQ